MTEQSLLRREVCAADLATWPGRSEEKMEIVEDETPKENVRWVKMAKLKLAASSCNPFATVPCHDFLQACLLKNLELATASLVPSGLQRVLWDPHNLDKAGAQW